MYKRQIKGGSFPVVECKLEDGEKMITESGSMVWMSPNMEMSTSGGGCLLYTSWADITKAELNWDNCYEDNHGVYTTSEPQQTAIAVSADTKGSPARWEHLPAKVLVGNTSVKVQYRVTEPDHSAAYTDQLYRACLLYTSYQYIRIDN